MDATLTALPNSISEADSLEGLARPMLEILEATTGLESTYLTTIDLTAGFQRILFSRNTKQMQIPEGLSVPWGDTLCKRAMEEGLPYTDDVSTCWGDSDAARALGIKTYVSQPVRMDDGAVFGTLCAAGADSVALRPGVLDVLAKFAKLIAQQVGRERALQATRQANVELMAHATTDPLTGIANRRGMEQELRRMLARAGRTREGLLVGMVDLDGFKAINDKYGHETGDRFLIHIARRLTAAVRPHDLVARTGGDEFVVLALGGSDFDLRERLEQATIGRFRHDNCDISYAGASVGVARSVQDAPDIEDLLRRADVAMYEAKRQRKSRH